MVTNLFTDNAGYWGDAVVTAVPNSTTFQFNHPGNVTLQTTPGVVALAYSAILDDALNSHFVDVAYDKLGENGHFNNFFDFWDDQNATVTHFKGYENQNLVCGGNLSFWQIMWLKKARGNSRSGEIVPRLGISGNCALQAGVSNRGIAAMRW
jgi:hypothetical protein